MFIKKHENPINLKNLKIHSKNFIDYLFEVNVEIKIQKDNF